MLAGYFRGRLETFAVGGVDVLLAFPPLVFALAVTAYLGQSVTNITPGDRRPGHSRLHARGARRHALLERARSSSPRPARSAPPMPGILIRELLPNVALPLLAFFLLAVAVTIVVEGALSFLGLGVPPPTASWGSMIGEGRDSLDIAPWLSFLPAGFMLPAPVLAFNVVGDTFRALADPRPRALRHGHHQQHQPPHPRGGRVAPVSKDGLREGSPSVRSPTPGGCRPFETRPVGPLLRVRRSVSQRL